MMSWFGDRHVEDVVVVIGSTRSATARHAHSEGHDRPRIADSGESHTGGGAVIGFRGRVGGRIDGPHILNPWERVARVSLVLLPLQVPPAVALHESHLVGRTLVCVVVLGVVDVPQQEAAGGEVSVSPLQLPVLDQKVLRLRCPIFP